MPTERSIRRALAKMGYGLCKSRVKTPHGNNLGGYMIYDLYGNYVVAGSRFELDLCDVWDWMNE